MSEKKPPPPKPPPKPNTVPGAKPPPPPKARAIDAMDIDVTDDAAAEPARDAANEARAHQRLPFEVAVDMVSGHNFFAGLTMNISEGGLFVATHHTHPVGTKLEIKLVFPGDEDAFTVETEVRWARLASEAGSEGPGLGLRFVNLTPEVRDRIHRFMKHRDPLYYED